MAKKGIFGEIEIGAAAIGQVSNISRSRPTSEIDVTVMNANGEAASLPGPVGRRMEVQAFFEAADAGQLAVYAAVGGDTPVAIAYYPLGKTTGNPVYTGNYFIGEDTLQQAADGAVEFNFTATGDGTGETSGTVP